MKINPQNHEKLRWFYVYQFLEGIGFTLERSEQVFYNWSQQVDFMYGQ